LRLFADYRFYQYYSDVGWAEKPNMDIDYMGLLGSVSLSTSLQINITI